MSVPMRICTNQEMRELDRIAETEFQIGPEILMENAGRGAVQQLFERYPQAGQASEILVFAGKGNNAGDAFVVARRLICLDRKVRIFTMVNPSDYKGATAKNFQILQRLKAKIMQLDSGADLEEFFKKSTGPFLAVDGILGTGLKGDVHGIFYDVIELINKHVQDVVALDIPSGVNGDSGAIHGVSILASLTVSFGFPKLGHFLPPGAGRRGALVNVDISLPPRFRRDGDCFLLMRGQMAALLKDRDRYGHKNSFGHALLVGGSPGKLGAITMAARAAHKMGTGLVTVATWADSLDPLLAKLPDETMAVGVRLDRDEDLATYRKKLPEFSSVVVGPGLGKRPEGKELLEGLIGAYSGPIVFDADALNLIAEHRLHEKLVARRVPSVLTPHIGEMARLLDIPKEKVMEDPVSAVRKAVELTHGVVLLKGAATLIGSPDQVLYLNHYPNDGMATAGSGDVLAGMIGGLAGQQMAPFEATQLAVYLHSLAGDFAAKKQGHRSMTAPDIIENIGNAFKDIKTKAEPSFPEEGRAKLV